MGIGKIFINAIIVAAMLLGWGATLPAADKGGATADKQIDIKSNELFTDSNKRTATFVGKVVAKQGDLIVYSDTLIIYYAEKGSEVERIEADGNVRIVQGNRIGTGGHAVRSMKEGTIVLTINPKVQDGEDSVVGKVITYYVDQEKSVVTSGPDARVRAIINPKGTGKDDAKP